MLKWQQLLISTLGTIFFSTSFAVAPGFYLGLMTGPASNTGKEISAQVAGSTVQTMVTPRSKQWGSRFYMGNKLSDYYGWELGLSFFSAIHYDSKNVITCSGLSSRVRDIDLLATGSFPFRSINLFGKAGVAYTYITTPGAFYSPPPGHNCGASRYDAGFKPVVAIGASYDMSPSWVLDASWTRTLVGSMIKNVDLFALGISYHFVDRYCGQFLCDY